MIEISMGLQELLGYTNNASHLTVIDFYADWCGPCQRAKPTYGFLSGKFDTNMVKFLTCNADRQRECVQHFNVSGLPTFVVYHGGQELLRSHDVNALNSALDGLVVRVRGNSAVTGGAGGRLSSDSSSRSTASGDPVTDKLLQLNASTNGKDVSAAMVESIRALLLADAAQQPMGLALLPFLASHAGSSSSGGAALEVLLSSLLHQERTQKVVSQHFAGLAHGIVNNILRYVLQMSLALTWDDRESVELLHTVLQSLLLSTTAQQLMVESPLFFNPTTIHTGTQLEFQTVLGGLFGVGPYSRQQASFGRMGTLHPPVHQEYAALQAIFQPQATHLHQQKVQEVQQIVDSLALRNNDLVRVLLRSKVTREATMLYFAEALRLNEGHQKTVTHNLPLSSMFFLTQLQIVLLTAAKPIFESFSGSGGIALTERIPPSYLLDDDPEAGCALVTFGKEVERVNHFDAENPLPAAPVHLPPTTTTSGQVSSGNNNNNNNNNNSSGPPGSSSSVAAVASVPTPFTAYKPFVHLYYLAVRATTVVTVPMIDTHAQFQRQARHRGASDAQNGVVTALYRIREGLLGSPHQSKLRLNFINDLCHWLLSVMEVEERGGVLPEKPPVAWTYLPQEVVDCAVKATELTSIGAVFTPHLNGLLLVLMGNSVYFPKPHTHVFSYLLTRMLRDPTANQALQRHPWFSSRIVRSCMNCYIAVEKAYYERSQVRYELSICLKQFLDSESLSAAVRDEMCDPNNSSLERFSHMAVAELNEAVDQMTETLKKMNAKIKEGADTSPNPPPAQRPASGGAGRSRGRGSDGQGRARGNNNNNNNNNGEQGNDEDGDEEDEEDEEASGPSYHQLGLGLNSYISLFFSSTDLFMTLARCFPAGVSQNMVAQQLSQVLARSLVTFAGRQSGQLKIQNSELYKFSPREILARLVDCLTPLTSSRSFLRCLCECGVPKDDILDAIERIISRSLVSSTHQMNLEVMRDAIHELSAEVEHENALWEDAPDMALDAILSTPLTDPVALPAEVRDLSDLIYVNRTTIHHHLLSDSTHPFTKEYLNEDMLNAFNARPDVAEAVRNRKKEIAEWLTEAKKQMKG